ncbi:phosphonate ABC transporter ATP-binding protein [Hyphomonas atlantica corrig.]|uniref:phosphonate ABC transporter ATP-binding protein n=1 Tax=Hyphomonas atlantica TaxID=1280948 RepID=UPI00235691C7|nr:phosphonate ABC transporter ATP-binding protein [Hyphomonas atlantica]
MLEIASLSKDFGAVKALDDVSLKIEPGEMVAVIGRSGAGKSTLLRCINMLETPTSGSIQCNQAQVSDLKGKKLNEWRARCAMIFQQFQLVPRLDVLTNVMIGALCGRPFWASMLKHFPAEYRARAVIELNKLGMKDQALQRAGTLSGGQQQRVAISRAMMQQPEILLADEPVASLDPRNTHAVMSTLSEINAERGITVLVNLHSIDIARQYCRRVIGLRDGRLVFDASIEELTDQALETVYDGDEIAEIMTPMVKPETGTPTMGSAA